MADSKKTRQRASDDAEAGNTQPKKLLARSDYEETVRRKAGFDVPAEPLVIDMSGGDPKPRLRLHSKTIPVTMDLPEHEHQKLSHASMVEAKPMKHLARDAMRIGLKVMEAIREGDQCAILGPTSRVKYRIGG